MTRRPPVAFGFDFDHTLGVDNGLERKALDAYANELGRPLDPHDAAARGRLEAILADFRAGATSMDDMIAHFAGAIGANITAARAAAARHPRLRAARTSALRGIGVTAP